MWSDNETNIDYLNHSEVAELVCDMIADKSLLPLSVGVYGGWGVGKSSILQFIRDKQEEADRSIIVEFDAWLYQGFDEAKSALMTVIAQQLIEVTPETLKEKAFDLFKRANKIKFLGLAAEAGLAAFGMPTFGFVSKSLDSAANVVGGTGDQDDLKILQDGVNAASDKAKGLFGEKEVRSAPEEITAFKSEFSALLKELDKTLVVFVDNLDRCLPKTAIQNLEAMRLFLSMPNTVFVIAADVDMVRHAVSREFAGPSKKHVDDYLDKLIHFPVTVPRLGLQEVQAYLTMLTLVRSIEVSQTDCEAVRDHLIGKIRNSWSDDSGITPETITNVVTLSTKVRNQVETALRMAPILAHSKAVLGNPRIIKRMMNVVSMRHSLANRRKMALDEAVVTKLSLFERCTNEQAFGDLLQMVHSAPKGKVKELSQKALENLTGKPIGFPESWKEHAEFIKEWGALAPDFSKIDLRPAVYLARETLPIQIRGSVLSPNAAKAIVELLKISTQTSRAAKDLVNSIPADELLAVMGELIAALKQNSDWSSRRKDLNGALILAARSADAKGLLVDFLRTIPTPAPWLKASMENLEKEDN